MDSKNRTCQGEVDLNRNRHASSPFKTGPGLDRSLPQLTAVNIPRESDTCLPDDSSLKSRFQEDQRFFRLFSSRTGRDL